MSFEEGILWKIDDTPSYQNLGRHDMHQIKKLYIETLDILREYFFVTFARLDKKYDILI